MKGAEGKIIQAGERRPGRRRQTGAPPDSRACLEWPVLAAGEKNHVARRSPEGRLLRLLNTNEVAPPAFTRRLASMHLACNGRSDGGVEDNGGMPPRLELRKGHSCQNKRRRKEKQREPSGTLLNDDRRDCKRDEEHQRDLPRRIAGKREPKGRTGPDKHGHEQEGVAMGDFLLQQPAHLRRKAFHQPRDVAQAQRHRSSNPAIGKDRRRPLASITDAACRRGSGNHTRPGLLPK